MKTDKKRIVANTPEKGKMRYSHYKGCIDKYIDANRNGFYLEAITLMESIIADRLMSYLIYKNIAVKEFITLGETLGKLKEDNDFPSDLREKISGWKNKRNSSLHEMAKLAEGETLTFDERYSACQNTAEEGYKIFREIEKFLAESKKKNKSMQKA